LRLDGCAWLEVNGESSQFYYLLGDTTYSIVIMENITQGEISDYRDAVLIEVVAELSRRDEYSAEKLLDWQDLGFR